MLAIKRAILEPFPLVHAVVSKCISTGDAIIPW